MIPSLPPIGTSSSVMPSSLGVQDANQPKVDFQKLLFDSISETNQLGHNADANIETRLLGGDITSTEVYTSLRKAEMALNMMIQVRNKLFTAYQEIQQMRM